MTKNDVRLMLLTRRDFLQVLGGTAIAAALVACGAPTVQQGAQSTSAPEPAAGEPQRGGTLRVAFVIPRGVFDPALITRLEDLHVALATHEHLVRRDANQVAQPGLALAWEPDEANMIWTFTLREGVTFHHGTPFTAKDVVFTYERALDPEMRSPGLNLMNMVDRVEAVDDTTVRFYLNAPTIDFPAYTSLGWFLIVAHDRTAEQLATEPSGTGPFRFSEQRAGEQTTMVRNEAYWNAPRPYLDELRFVYIADAAARIEALRSNIVDVIWQIEPEVVAALEQNADLQVIKTPSGEHNSLVMDVTSAPFDDVRVRQAFKHCVDREGMVQAVLQGYGVAGNDQPVAPNDPAWADIAPLAYDPARAKALLAEAGYPDGLEITLATSDSRPGMVPMAVAFQEMAKPAGITVAIERHPGETYWTEVFMQTNFFTSKWSVFANADMLLHMGYRSDGAWLETGIQDPALDALISEVRSEADPAQRQAMYREIQELISYEGGEIIPYFKSLLSTAHAKVQGVQMLTTSWMYFDETWLTTA